MEVIATLLQACDIGIGEMVGFINSQNSAGTILKTLSHKAVCSKLGLNVHLCTCIAPSIRIITHNRRNITPSFALASDN
jgi:hypothetical protein